MSSNSESGSSRSPGKSGFVPPSASDLDAILDQYEFIEMLGRGGMGAVYKARQKSLDRLVAIKILPAGMAGEEEDGFRFEERFQREARAMAKLSHPNIIAVYDFGQASDGQFYFVMEYIEGCDLHGLIRGGGLTTDHVSGWMPQICEALQYAHSKGIVHRDIKPANIMITTEGQVKIADFGLAKITGADVVETKLTMTNMAMGTPDYVAPEALEEGVEVDHRADLYAVGVMLYEMLTGKVPRGAWKAPSVQVPGLDPRYDDLIVRAMDSDRTTRHQQATEISATIYEIATTPATPSGGVRKMIVPDEPSGIERTGAASTAVKKDTTLRPYQGRQQPAVKPRKRWGLIAGLTSALIFLGIGLKPLLTPDPEPTAIPIAPTALKSDPAPPPAPDKVVGTPTKAPVPSSQAPVPPPAPIVPGDLIFEGHRYRLIAEKLTWDEARVKAEEMGGHLATITSKEENEWLMKNLKYPPGWDKHLHIGGYLPSSGSAWEWITGEPFEMSLWGGAGPDGGLSGGQNGPSTRLTLYGDKWDDIPLRFPSNYLVEWDTDVPVNSLTAAPATPAGSGVVDLLALADLTQSGLLGKWEKLPEGLRVNGAEKLATVEFDQPVPEEYDFEMEFTATGGVREVNQGLVVSGRPVKWTMGFAGGDPTPFNFGPLLDGQNPSVASRTEATVIVPRLKQGQRYRSLVEVRRGSLRALIDGREVLKYSGDMTRLTSFGKAAEVGARLGVGVFMTDATFHKAELRPVKTEPVTSSPAITGNPASATPAPAAGPDPAVSPTTPPVRAGEEAGWIDLLELADVTQHSLLGQWTLEDGKLRNPDLDGKGESPHATFALTPPVTASRFDLRWRFTTEEVTRGILFPVFPFPKQGENTFVGSSLHLIEREEQSMKKDWFQEVGKTREVLISVRDEVVQVFLDGELISEDKGSPTQGLGTRVWFRGDKIKGPIIGIGTLNGRIAVTGASYRVVEPTNAPELSAVDSIISGTGATTKDGLLSNDPRIAQLDAGFKARYESDAQQPFLSAVATLNQSYTANGIGRARAAAQAKGNLSEVTALDAEKAALESGKGVPVVDAPQTPESIKTLRETYRSALAKLTAERDAKAAPLLDIYLKALDVYTIELTKAGRIAEAKELKALRDARAGQPTTEAPVANSAPAAGVKDDTKKTTTGSGGASQLAEWVLLHGGELTIEGVGVVKEPDQLKPGRITIVELTFPSDEATVSEFELLAGLKDLRRLRIDGSKVVNLDFLKNLTELQSLRLSGAVLDLEGFSLVGSLKDLPGLELFGNVTDDQIARLSGLEELSSLTMEIVPTGTGFAGMKASKELRVLNLGDNGSAITDEGLTAIAATFPKLENCHLAPWDNATSVTNEGLKVLLPLRSLTTLNVTGKAVDDGAVETLSKLRGLTGLMIRGTSISSEGTEKLRKALSDCTVTN